MDHTSTQHTKTQHSTALVTSTNNRVALTGTESRKLNNIECVFNGNIDKIELQHDILSGMCIFIIFYFFVFMLF